MDLEKKETKKNDPAREKSSAKQSSASYVCPMHPEITSDKPAECSKCGMTLVPKKIEQSR